MPERRSARAILFRSALFRASLMALASGAAVAAVSADRISPRSGPSDLPPAEISIDFIGGWSSIVPPGALYSYGFVVRASALNGAPAKNVVFTSTTPKGTEFQSVDVPVDTWTCTTPPIGSQGTVTCSIASLEPGDGPFVGATLKVAKATPPGTDCSAIGTVRTDSPQDTSDDQASTPPCVVALDADVAATLNAPFIGTAGADMTYHVGVIDNGPGDAQSVALSFPTPAGTTFGSTHQTQGPVFGCTSPAIGATGTVACTAAALGAGQTALFDVVVHVVDTTSKLAAATVTSTTTPPDPNPSNDTATATTFITKALLDVSIVGTGTVTSSPRGVDCAASCTTSLTSDSVLSLNAAASPGLRFAGWSGACTGTGSCLVTMSATHSVTATFVTGGPTFELTVARQGSGSGGTVTSASSGIACGVACAASYGAGEVVTLTVADDSRALFIAWGGACAGTGSCTVAMNGDTTVTAEFVLLPSILGPTDVDGDGRDDLLFGSPDRAPPLILLMDGTRVVAEERLDNMPAEGAITHAADFNGDGRTDLVWNDSATGRTALFLMNGTSFPPTAVVLADPAWRVTLVGDFDGDGKADLVWRNDATGETAIWLMNGLAMKAGAVVMGDAHWRAAYAADFNGDGKTDLVWRNDATGETALWVMDGTTFTGGGTVLADGDWSVIATGDFDGDGKADLVWHNVATGETSIWLMDGATYKSGAIVLTNHAWGVTHVADLDGDGRSDLILHNGSTGETALWLMNGATRGAAVKLTGTEDYDMVRTADLNGDGKADLVWLNRVTGRTKVWLMDGITRIDFSPQPLTFFSVVPL